MPLPEARLLWLPLLVAGGLLYLWLAAALVRRRAGPGSRTMGLALCAVAAWLVAAVAEVLVPSLPAYFAPSTSTRRSFSRRPASAFILHHRAFTSGAARAPPVVPACTIAMVWMNPGTS
jgi:hypothetical protein